MRSTMNQNDEMKEVGIRKQNELEGRSIKKYEVE